MSFNFTKGDIDHFLYLIAKEYKKMNKSNPDAEIILVGSSSIVVNYGFRGQTTDLDSIIRASSNIKEIINKIGDENGLPTGWINEDFKTTSSYSPKIILFSKYYKTFNNCLKVRTIQDEYLIAMKIKSGRLYKYDLSDIVGIIKDKYEQGTQLKIEDIQKAYLNLYDEQIPKEAEAKIIDILNCPDYENLYYSTVKTEQQNKTILLNIQDKYEDLLNNNNVNDFLTDVNDNYDDLD